MKVLLNFSLLSIELPYSPSEAGIIRNQLLDSADSADGVTDQYQCDEIKHKSQQDMQRQEDGEILLFYKDDSWSRTNFLWSCRGIASCLLSCVFKSKVIQLQFTIYSGLRGATILCGRGLHYAHGFVLDPNLDIFWDQRDKVGTLFVNSVNLDHLYSFQ